MTAKTQPSLWARTRWIAILAVLMTIGVTTVVASRISQDQTLAAQAAEIADLEAAAAEVAVTQTQQAEENALAGLGVSPARVKKDTQTIGQFLDLAFTWYSGTGYEDAREALKDRFALTEEDPFLQDFMPPSRFNVDEAGKRYYYLDAIGLNAEPAGDLRVEVVEVMADKYRYAVMADIEMNVDGSQTDTQGREILNPSVDRRVLLYITVDTEGSVSDIVGIPPSGSTRTSN